ncbi:MAG: MlaD family protein [bacterium]|nr:MlaD family protein [bacterium]MDT8395762.1 MlaD family protein [bacterium]
MRSFKTETYVGLFVLTGFLIFIWGTTQITNLGDDGGYELYAVFDNAAGLDINAPVRMVGVNIGRVRSIDITDRKAWLALLIDKDRQVDRNATVSIRSQGILGDKFVGVDPGDSGSYYNPGDTITRTRAGADLDRLMDSLQTAGQDLSAILSSLRKVIGTEDGERSMAEILENTRALSSNLSAMVSDNRDRVDNIMVNLDHLTSKLDGIAGDNREDIREVIANIRQVTEDIRDDLPRLTQKLEGAADQVSGVLSDNRESVKVTVEQIRKDAELLEETLASLRTVARRIESGEGTVGKLINEDETYISLNETLGSLSKAMKKGEQLQINLDIHGHYLSEIEGTKGYLTMDIKPTPDKFYRLELVDDPEGLRDWTNTTVTEVIPPAPPTTTITDEIRYQDRLKFSIELGRRIHDTVFRLGYIESAFGFGVDRYFAGDDMRLSLDAWELDRDENARVRVAASFRFWDLFHLDVGAEDIINENRDPMFMVGFGLSFIDEDLKYLLAKSPIP